MVVVRNLERLHNEDTRWIKLMPWERPSFVKMTALLGWTVWPQEERPLVFRAGAPVHAMGGRPLTLNLVPDRPSQPRRAGDPA